MNGVTHLADMGALAQRDMVQTVKEFRPTKARTLATFEQGTRKKTARLAGIQIPFWKDHKNGQGNYNPVAGQTSFSKGVKQATGAMYGGLAFRNMHLDLEDHIMMDMNRGFLPDSYIDLRRRAIETHMMKKNWAAIGDGTGAIAEVVSCVGATLTCSVTNAARGTSKGSFRLQSSSAAEPLLYSAINKDTDTEVARFFVTSKPTLSTAVVSFTVGNTAALNVAGLKIVETNIGWKREMIGLAGHISDQNRIYQGADTAVDDFLKNPGIDGGNVNVTPTMIDSAKNIAMTRANDLDGRNGLLAHITPGNLSILAAFGYTGRVYNAEGGKANTTYGLPDKYEDGDTTFAVDPDYEDGFIDFRETAPYFEYVQKEFGLKKTEGQGRHEWIGANQAGSTESYENYNEACNIVWDGRGKDGDRKGGGSPNSAVFIRNIALPPIKQASYGI